MVFLRHDGGVLDMITAHKPGQSGKTMILHGFHQIVKT